MLLGLAACASDPGTATDDPADSASGGGSTPAATADGDTVKIGVVAAISGMYSMEGQMVIKGLVIVLAVIIDQFQRNLQAKMALRARNEGK